MFRMDSGKENEGALVTGSLGKDWGESVFSIFLSVKYTRVRWMSQMEFYQWKNCCAYQYLIVYCRCNLQPLTFTIPAHC
jgi:hypothetical protein